MSHPAKTSWFSFVLLTAMAPWALADVPVEDISLNPAPAPAPVSTPAASPAHVDGGPDMAERNWQKMQDLEDQIRRLRGQLEEQQHTMDLLRAQLKTQYINMDQRLSATDARVTQLVTAQAAAATASPASGGPTATTASTPTTDNSFTVDTEKTAYLAAYQVYRKQGPDAAIPQMLAFVHQYPQSVFLPHADYWLGEFYLNQQTPDLKRATSYFQTVITQFPKHSKAPAALYNLAMIQDKQNKIKAARASLQSLLKQYPDSPEAKPAQSWLDNEAKHKKNKHSSDSHQQDKAFVKNVKSSLDNLNQDAPNP